jgi:hypothetical protein
MAGFDNPSATSYATSSSRCDSGPVGRGRPGREMPRRRNTRSALATPVMAPISSKRAAALDAASASPSNSPCQVPIRPDNQGHGDPAAAARASFARSSFRSSR